MPALACWPFLSAVPAFKIFADEATASGIALQLIFLATGFWSVFALYLGAEFVRHRTVKLFPIRNGNGNGLLLGAYATVWTIAYALVLYVVR